MHWRNRPVRRTLPYALCQHFEEKKYCWQFFSPGRGGRRGHTGGWSLEAAGNKPEAVPVEALAPRAHRRVVPGGRGRRSRADERNAVMASMTAEVLNEHAKSLPGKLKLTLKRKWTDA